MTKFELLLINCILVTVFADIPSLKEQYFDQYVDHFNFGSYGNKMFPQRYLYTDQFWKSGSVMLFYTGNEGDITNFAENTGVMFTFAKKLSAYVIFAEHRYYGKSLPFGNYSFTKDKISLLTVEQTLADYAVLINHFKETLGKDLSVITFGGSYGGMLSAYMRFKYPNLVVGAIASSAPIVSCANLVPQTYFFEDVTKDYHNVDTNCSAYIRSSFDQIKNLSNQGTKGLDKLSTIFRLCQPLISNQDVQHLNGWIRNAFTTQAMVDYPYATTFLGRMPAYPVNVSCNFILESGGSLDGLVSAAGLSYNGTGDVKCFDIFDEYVECSDPTGCGLGNNALAWDYQACTEIVLPSGSNGKTDMFSYLPFTPDMRAEYCHQKWGVVPRNNWLNINMWGKDLNGASNIVFTNGDLDPWRRGGVSNVNSSSVEYYLIQGGAHHLDLRSSNSKDPQSVIYVREQQLKSIQQWIMTS